MQRLKIPFVEVLPGSIGQHNYCYLIEDNVLRDTLISRDYFVANFPWYVAMRLALVNSGN